MYAWCLAGFLLSDAWASERTCVLERGHKKGDMGSVALKVEYDVADRDLMAMFPAGAVDGIKGIVRQTLWVSGSKSRSERVGELVEPKLVGSTIRYLPKPYHSVTIARPEITYNYDQVTKKGSRALQGQDKVPGDSPAAMAGLMSSAMAGTFPQVDAPGNRTFLGVSPTCYRIPPEEQDFIMCGGEIAGYNVTLFSSRRGTFDPQTRVTREAISAESICVPDALFQPEGGIKWR